MADRPWRIDAGVARDLAEALGWSGDDGVAALATRFPERVPMGSTAKLAAVADGEVPPGDDPGALARRLLAHRLDVAAAPAGGAPSPAWSCWVAGTVMAALVDAAELGPVDVAAIRRIDDASPLVDLHAAVVVGADDGGSWIADPYFGAAVALPPGPRARGAADDDLVEARAERDAGSGWTFDVRVRRWDAFLRYRLLGPALDRGDVRALAAVSVTHTGVPSRPYVRLHVGGAVVDASESDDGTAPVRSWTPTGGLVELGHASWPEAAAGFAALTGTRPI